MNIYIDESGSFVNAPNHHAWNVVVSYAVPETDIRALREVLNRLKRSIGYNCSQEVKLKDIDENAYLSFLGTISKLGGVVFCTATDAGLNSTDAVVSHRDKQAAKITEHVDKMLYEGGRKGMQYLADQILSLPPQLYVQLTCQLDLMFHTICRAILFFVQRQPTALRHFRWRIDRKSTKKTNLEDAFEKLSPALIQSRSLESPLIMVEGFDYGCLKEYFFEEGQEPTYLRDTYGINVDVKNSLNIQKLIRGDIKFVNSEKDTGVQVADLIAAGIRRCLRRGFADNEGAATLLGRFMIQAEHNAPPITLTSYSDSLPLSSDVARLVRIFIESCKPMVKRS